MEQPDTEQPSPQDSDAPPSRGGRAALIAPALILLLALALRLYGIDWDQGGLFHPDERAILFRVNDLSWPPLSDLGVLLNVDESPLNPRWFPYGSLPIYAGMAAESLLSPFATLDFRDLRFLGRGLSTLADVGTVLMVFLLGCRLYGRRAGLLAALLAAVAVIHVQMSHFYTSDTFLTFFIVAAMYFMARRAQEGGLKNSLLAGVFIGLALASKISVAPLLLALVLAHAFHVFSSSRDELALAKPRRPVLASATHHLLLSCAAALLVFFLATPYAFLDWSKPNPCPVPYSALSFLDQNYYACDVGGEYAMARGISGRPYTQQYIDTTPYWYHVRQLALFGLGLPLGIAAWASILFTIGLAIARRSKADLLLLAWVVPYFMLTGFVQVKFLRYMLPLTPFLIIMACHMLLWARDWAAAHSRERDIAMRWGIGLVVGATAFYALSYTTTYAGTHNANRASEWIRENVPTGSVILMEHWEESLPNMEGYVIGCRGVPDDNRSCMTMYDSDSVRYSSGQDKIERVAEQLAGADYLVFFSNRLYGSTARLPEKYPLTGEYYRRLFGGELGYELAHWETDYPSILGVAFVDDTLTRPGLPTPVPLGAYRPAPLSIGMGYADESFSVYDRPKVLVFENRERLEEGEILRRILTPRPQAPTTKTLLLSDATLAAQREGGTWTDIVDSGSLSNRFPIGAWYLWVQVLALAALPLSLLAFRPLPDRGYLLAKPLGILVVAYGAWALASLQWMPFSRGSVMIVALLLAGTSAVAAYARRAEMLSWFRQNVRLVVIGEALFAVSFGVFLLVRAANPDLWHPFNGGEKPMEMAYLNAAVRSTFFPPYDPWFAGGYINYYYFGQMIVASLVRATGITTEVAFNLAVPLFFALTTSAVFSLVYSLAMGTRRGLGIAGGQAGAVAAGLVGAVFVAVLGNLDGAVQLAQGASRAIFSGLPLGEFDFWRSSRLIPPGDPPGHEITEFPFFTFLFGDLHAHMMAIPFALLAVGLSLSLALRIRDGAGILPRVAHLLALALAVGSLRAINTWDYPTQLAIGGAAVLLGEYARSPRLTMSLAARVAVQSAFLFWATTFLFAPFIQGYQSFSDGVFPSRWQTPLYSYVGIHGLFLFVIASFLVYSRRSYLPRLFEMATGAAPGRGLKGYGEELAADAGKAVRLALLGGLPVAVLLALALSGYATAAFILLLLMPTTVLAWKWAAEGEETFGAFALLMLAMAFSIGVAVELITIENDISRMNTVFKFYLQAWALMAAAAAYLLWRMGFGVEILGRLRGGLQDVGLRRRLLGAAWLGMLALLVVSSAIYTVGGTQDRLRDRFEVLPLTLDGLAFMESASYTFDRGSGTDSLADEYDAIQWLRSEEVSGSPVVLEGHGELYRSLHTRVAIYTGLPTVIGWDNHQSQQRGGAGVSTRLRDVQRIYSTTVWDVALELMDKYSVEYVYVGEIERHYYPDAGLDKFGQMVGTLLELAYS
ncbi:MAG: DUF2298 domain-containing protein, partial [Chloroflexota bacterium]|nr:DUF2298 domain-containing protein [Chloroflexota bacterium]